MRNNWPESISHLGRSRALFRDLGDTEQELEAQLHLGVSYWDYARYDQAVACFREVLPGFRQLGNELLEASTYHNLGLALREQGDIDGAMECFDHCLPVFTLRDDHIGRARALHSVGVALRYLGRHEEAGPLYQESLQLCRAVGDLRWEGILLLATGRLRRQQGRLEDAAGCRDAALPLFLRLGDVQGEAHTYRSVSHMLRDQGDLDGSAAYLTGDGLLAELQHERGIEEDRHAMAITQMHRGALDDAVASLRASLAIFRPSATVPGRCACQMLGRTLSARSDQAAATEAWRDAVQVLEGSCLPPRVHGGFGSAAGWQGLLGR